MENDLTRSSGNCYLIKRGIKLNGPKKSAKTRVIRVIRVLSGTIDRPKAYPFE